MKNIVKHLAVISCFAFGATLAQACPNMNSGEMQGQADKKMCPQMGGKMHGQMGGIMLKDMDANGDGIVERNEFDASHDKYFKMMDSNGDGKIDSDEMGAWRQKCAVKGQAL
ncbi:MAG TPA: hypothetical protein VMW07_00395 [Gallionella sp.]|jgi:Ca2+-binding EF-hand superfamily protein|nr:hypothetical protein [Gallionella sp.]